MSRQPANPSLYQINTRVWLTALSKSLGRPATLDDIPDAELDRIAAAGFDWVWFLSVWQTGPAARKLSLSNAEWRREFEHTLPDLHDDDIGGSGFAITNYTVHKALGGDDALARLRERMRTRRLRLMLDFVPNHVAPDHPWLKRHSDFFVHATLQDLAAAPQNYCRMQTPEGPMLLAYGRDPYFPGWPDTLQLNYANKETQEAMIGELLRISRQCDGVRCDMAMLVTPNVFKRTWGLTAEPFWPEAIRRVRDRTRGFTFMAEVYWDMEFELQQQGFDYTYDKRLYDRLREQQARAVREHLFADIDYQSRMARFLENHDEPRAAATFPPDVHKAAAVVTFLTPGLRFFHQGQLEGHTVRISPHLVRASVEPVNEDLKAFYDDLLKVLRRSEVRDGQWRLVECAPAWEGNPSADAFIAWIWTGKGGDRLLVVVNYSSHDAQCYVRLPFDELRGRTWTLTDLLGPNTYDREGSELALRGLYLDVRPWTHHVFTFRS
jgi:glycosidase